MSPHASVCVCNICVINKSARKKMGFIYLCTHTRYATHTFLIHKLVRPVFPSTNEPAAVAVLLAMNAQIMLGVGPFVSFLSNHIVPDTAGERLVEV